MGGRGAGGTRQLALCPLLFSAAALSQLRAPQVRPGHLQGAEKVGGRQWTKLRAVAQQGPSRFSHGSAGPTGTYSPPATVPGDRRRPARFGDAQGARQGLGLVLQVVHCQPASLVPGLLARAGPPVGADTPAAKPPLPSPTHRPLSVHPGGGDGACLLRVSPCEFLHQQRLLRESGEKSGRGGPSAQSTGVGKPRRRPGWSGSKAQTPSSASEARILTPTQPSRLMASGFGPAPEAQQMPAHLWAFVQLLPPPGPRPLPRLTLMSLSPPPQEPPSSGSLVALGLPFLWPRVPCSDSGCCPRRMHWATPHGMCSRPLRGTVGSTVSLAGCLWPREPGTPRV